MRTGSVGVIGSIPFASTIGMSRVSGHFAGFQVEHNATSVFFFYIK
jgi:hypothetical protein